VVLAEVSGGHVEFGHVGHCSSWLCVWLKSGSHESRGCQQAKKRTARDGP
jgi:hypothetical protein